MKDQTNMAYTHLITQKKLISTFPYTDDPETAPTKTLNSDVPGTYIIPLIMQVNMYMHIALLIIFPTTPSLACSNDTKMCKCKLIGLACESRRLRGETVPASCN